MGLRGNQSMGLPVRGGYRGLTWFSAGIKLDDATLERQEDEARWARYQETGQAIFQERVMQWLDNLAEGRREPLLLVCQSL